MIIEKLVAELGWDLTGEQDLRKFKSGMDKAAAGAARMATAVASAGAIAAGAFAAIGAGMFKLAKDAAGPLDELVKFSDRVNVNIEALQEWQFAAEQSGASAGEFQGAVTTLSKNLAEVARGTGRAEKAFKDYGISAKDAQGRIKSADVVMGELAEKFQKLTDQQALDLGQKLGMTPGMITLLKSGTAEIDKLRQQARDNGLVFTEEEARNAERFNDSLNLFQRSIKAISHRIGVEFLPVLADGMDYLQGWIRENQTLIRSNIEVWSGRVVSAMQGFLSLTGRIGTSLDQVGGYVANLLRFISANKIDLDNWQGLLVFAGALGAAFRPAIAAMAALFLIVDDLLAWGRGGKSVFGDMLEGISKLGEVDVDNLKGLIDTLAMGATLAAAGAGFAALAAGINPLTASLAALGIAFGGAKAALEFFDVVKGNLDQKIAGTKAVANPRAQPGYIESAGYDEQGRFIYMDGPSRRVDKPSINTTDGFTQDALDLKFLLQNAEENLAKMGAGQAGAAVESTINDNSDKSVSVIVNQTVQQATDAPAAVAGAVGNAAAGAARSSGLPPTRISGTGAF
uniref:Phage tail tape measure protein n=1 Tax=Agrobacterium albertimagni TaxID=147266 RepID=A0A7C1NVR9_9HYPH